MHRIIACGAVVLLTLCGSIAGSAFDPSYSSSAPVDTSPFFPNATFDRSVPQPNDYLLRPLGEWPLRYHELEAYLNALDGKSPRVRIESQAVTYEGRKLYNVFISSEENIRNLEKIGTDMATFADPATLPRDANAIAAKLPAIAWMAYSVHGDECSGVDAAVALIYHFAAATDTATKNLLEHLVIIIDPTENPDGRERFLSMLETYRGSVPNYNSNSLSHRGGWPWGRGNHYWFDMNRDWAVVTQPETKGRIATILKWHPQLVVDAHELEPDGTFLSNPPREPINYNVPDEVKKWWLTFNAEQGSAFDRYGWPHYSKEWFEAWYPGYGDFWASFSGSIGILYEQARVGGELIKQEPDYILTYHEAVHHQIVASIANLTTLSNHRDDILRDYRAARVQNIEAGRKSGLSFVFPPDRDISKMNTFLQALLKQRIDIQKATSEFALSGVDSHGNKVAGIKAPAGSYIVSTAQVQGTLAKAILEFDPRLKLPFLEEERKYRQKKDQTRVYDVTAWSLPLAYALTAYQTTSPISVKTESIVGPALAVGQVVNSSPEAAYVVDMVGEATNQFLIKAFEDDLTVFSADKAFTVEGHSFKPGSLVFRVRGNVDSLGDRLKPIAEETGLIVYGVHTFETTEGPALGAPAFRPLAPPKVALIVGDGLDFTSAGSIWYMLDQELKLPHSLFEPSDLQNTDLSEFNVLIIPSSWGPIGERAGKGAKETLDSWVQNGGTLICVGNAATWAADTATGLSMVRSKSQVLDKLEKFAANLKREQAPATVDTTALWYPEKAPAEKKETKETPPATTDEAKDLDAFQSKFSPNGVILRVNLDPESWLAFGVDSILPVMSFGQNAFLSSQPVRTIGRFADQNTLRLSGLLWPEARARWANTAYLTQEGKGKGQVILFADEPDFRAYFWGTRQLLVNAILYGPSFGGGGFGQGRLFKN